MTSADIAAQLDVIEAEISSLRALLQGTAICAQPEPPRKQPVAERRPRWELAAKAFKRFAFEPHTIRRICSNHPEWAKRLTDGAWYVDADLFDEFAARVERGECSFAVSAKSAVSVAENVQLAITVDHPSVYESEDAK
ncbi:hypothetical protein IVA96_20165 [Bradyrhizobium sp. 159]|uniref:hypothetical protein n=1 Tax=Bradyrhizobium sp. 159 TaxID=2782632 RepID=UPI001FFA68A1|nr:hypothetical protein [Bradyrhizobium sp. 159]MCK1618908.1 hypothetical protein [Bradyrhizobium sp. 159]